MNESVPVKRSNEAMGAAEARLAMSAVSRRFDRFPAVRCLSLALKPGEILCLLGPSGCGKSTTLRLAAGLERPDEGRITIDGRLVDGPGVHVPPEARSVGLIFQDYALFPHLSVLANVAFGLDRLPAAERKKRALAALDRVGMVAFAGAFPHTLSGGEQQRVALARALAPRPRVMLMDEPFSGLDAGLRAQVRDETLAIMREEGIAALLVTHDPIEALVVGDRLALMRAGEIVQEGPPQEVYDRPRDLWAARFLGEVALLPAVVKEGKAATALGSFAAGHLTEGARALVAVRPHVVRLAPANLGQGTPARVRRSRSLGPVVALEVEIGGASGPHSLTVHVPAEDAPAPGSDVALIVDAARILVYPDPEAEGAT